MVAGATAVPWEVAAAERSSAVSLLMWRKMLWRSKSQSKLYASVVLGDHDGVEHEIRGAEYGRGEARRRAEAPVAVRHAAAVRESRGRR